MIPMNLLQHALQVAQELNRANSVLIVSHARPDGDAIGSVAGLCKSLSLLNKSKLEVALLDGVPERFAFAWQSGVEPITASEIDVEHDVLIHLDCGDETRSGIKLRKANSNTIIINLDHHSSNTMFGDINYVDVGASSTCEMVCALLTTGNLPINADIGLSIMLGLITDSRSFQNEGLRATAHLAAAKLLDLGVDTTPIYACLNNNKSNADLRVQGFGLTNFKLECNNKLATLVIKQTDLNRLHANTGNIFASGIFNIPLTMKDTIANVVIFEKEDGVSACEFRARNGIDVKSVAVALGGGGHLLASGCSQQVPIEQLALEAIALMKKQIEEKFK